MDWFTVRVVNPTTHDHSVVMVKAVTPGAAHLAAATLYRRNRRLKAGVHVNTLTLDRSATCRPIEVAW